jgi:peptidoglycan/LPS O-acetylase OafA/YrhL
MEIRALLLLFILQSHSASIECKSELDQMIAITNHSLVGNEHYQKMVQYSGITVNNLGNFDSCNEIDSARYVLFVHKNRNPRILQTLCGPISCSEEDYRALELPFLIHDPAHIVFPSKYQEDAYSTYTTSAILMIIFMFEVVGIAIIATICEYSLPEKQNYSTWYEILLCFSLIRNGKVLFLQRSKEKFGETNTFDVLDGARVMSIGWIILFHSLLVESKSNVLVNYDTIKDRMSGLDYILVITGSYAVDTFLWISGFLMTYFLLSEIEKTENYSYKNLFKLYLQRYARITPSLMVVILFFMSMEKYIGNGPLFYNISENQAMKECDDYLYTMPLYLNNFIPENKGNQCLSQAWYLAIDMQYFLAFSVVVLIYSKLNKALGWAILLFICCGGVISSGIVASSNDLKAGKLIDLNKDEYNWYYYKKPYTRSPPYALAVASGFMLYSYRRFNDKKEIYDRFALAILKTLENRYTRVIAFALGVALINILIFFQYDLYSNPGANYEYEEWTKTENYTFIALERIGFGLGVTFILLPLLLGYFSGIVAFMACPVWSFFSRISYNVFLIHYPLMYLVFYSSKAVSELNIFNTIRNTAYFFVLSCVCALPIALLIEFPINNVLKLAFRESVQKPEYTLLKNHEDDLKWILSKKMSS